LIHESAYVEKGSKIGEKTNIWHFAHIRKNARIGKNCNIGKSVYIDINVKIGNNCKIQNFASLYQGLSIGNNVFIGPHVCFTNDLYPRAKIWSDEKIAETVVENGASIGANSTIIAGVTIGKNALVGAGSVVTKDISDNALVYGNPAKIRGFVCTCGRKLEKKEEIGDKIVFSCSECNIDIEIKKEFCKELDL